MARARRRRSILGASLVLLALCLLVASDLTLKRVECSSDRWSKEGKRTGNKQEQQEVDFGQQDTFRTTVKKLQIKGYKQIHLMSKFIQLTIPVKRCIALSV